MKRSLLHLALPLAILVELAGLGVTIYGYHALKHGAMEADAVRFDRLVDGQMEDLTTRLKSYESVLHGGIGLLSASEEVTTEEWRNYVLSIPLQATAPGILGFGTIVPVPAAEREELIAEFEGIKGEFFEYKTVGGVEPPADVSYVIDRIEPIELNRTALGLDIGSENNRREAFEKARDSGEPQITGIITLVQDDQKTPGFLLIIPRYRMGEDISDAEARRKAFLDAVYAPMIGKDILSLPARSPEIAFRVYDEEKTTERLIHGVPDPAPQRMDRLEQLVEWPYAGRKWLIHTWSTDKFFSKTASREQSSFLYFGISLSTLLAILLFSLHRGHAKAVELMNQYHQQADEQAGINKLFVEHAPAAIAIFDNKLHFLATSKGWMEQFELTEDVTGRHHYDVFPEILEIPEFQEAHRRGLAGENLCGGADRFERLSGKVHYLRWEVHPWRGAEGKIGGIIVFSIDVTEEVRHRRRLEEAQREVVLVEERLRQATEAGNVGVWDWRIEEDQLTWNEQMFSLFGIRRADFRGTIDDFRQAIDDEDLPKVNEAMRKSLEQGEDFEMEYRTQRKDRPTLLAVGRVHRDDDGKAERMLGVCVDVSAQAKARKEMMLAMESHEAARREAESLARSRQQFLATMSHEIRTPMNGMIGMSQLLLESELNGDQYEYAKTIVECGNTLMELVNNILDVSRIEAGAMELERKPYNPGDLIRRVNQIVSHQAQAKGIELVESIASSVPAEVIGDAVRMQQVLLNLISNAVKFTAEGSVMVSLACEKDAEQREYLLYEVRDTGSGMSEEELSKVFTPFVQADASITRKHGGSGLGLSISRSLILLMGGRLDMESAPGKGSVARVIIPVIIDKEAGAPSTREDAEVEGSTQELKIGRLLIVEDNPVNQRVTELQMKRYAEIIEIAKDGREAVACHASGEYDLILMDCQMPVMDGFEAVHLIRKHESEQGSARVPIIALTANVQDRDRLRAAEAGMDGFISKPLQLDVLKKELNRLLQR